MDFYLVSLDDERTTAANKLDNEKDKATLSTLLDGYDKQLR
jgi:hypothetical protein